MLIKCFLNPASSKYNRSEVGQEVAVSSEVFKAAQTKSEILTFDFLGFVFGLLHIKF